MAARLPISLSKSGSNQPTGRVKINRMTQTTSFDSETVSQVFSKETLLDGRPVRINCIDIKGQTYSVSRGPFSKGPRAPFCAGCDAALTASGLLCSFMLVLVLKSRKFPTVPETWASRYILNSSRRH